MDLTKAVAELKKRPQFTDQVGMILIHHGVVRNWSRAGRARVAAIEVTPNPDRIEALRREYLRREGIFEILIEAKDGTLHPGDDLLFIIVAGDLRENIKPVLSDLLDRIKSEAVVKKEIFTD